MSARGVPAPAVYEPAAYWEDRARRFAAEGAGLAAVCSYGMPRFYNAMIDLAQRRALAPWLAVRPGARVLDVGCGVGRWSERLAARGAQVTGIDLSPTMVREARRRTARAGLAGHCRFAVCDVAQLDLAQRFELILSVTVHQHILDPVKLRRSLEGLIAHLEPGGRIVMLEAAPDRPYGRCDTTVFQARCRSEYLALFTACGLRLRALSGVDPAPFKTWLLPHLPRLPAPLRLALLALVTALSAPLDALLGRRAVTRSWHAVFVLERATQGVT